MAGIPPILVASDLGARSDRAIDRALSMAREMNCGVLLVHVLDGKAARDGSGVDRLQAVVREDLGERADSVEIRLEQGSVPSALSRVAREVDTPVIVTGTARFKSPADFVLGTAVDYLVRRSPVPVLVVRRRPWRPYRWLLVMTDFSRCSQAALEAANDFFPDAGIELLHVLPPSGEGGAAASPAAARIRAEAESEMADFLSEVEESVRHRVSPRLEEGDIEEVVEDRFLRGAFDLLILGTHGRGAVAHATIGSRASALLAASLSDVMMVRER